MAVSRIACLCAGALVAAGIVFFLGATVSAGAEPVPAQAALQPAPQPDSSPGQAATTSQQPAESLQPTAASDLATEDPDEQCAMFCGMPCCSPPGRIWLRADYLMWWTNGVTLPPLVTTSPQGTAVEDAGVLGLSTTTILYGNSTVGNQGQSGVRTTMGMWLDSCHRWAVEFDYLNLGGSSDSFSQTSTGETILARPFYNVETGSQASELVAYPGVAIGSISVDFKDYFQSAGALFSYNLCCCNSCGNECDSCDSSEQSCGSCVPLLQCCRTDLVAGFRYYNLGDSLTIHETPTLTESVAPHDTIATFDIHDNFRARNDFYGSELGLRTRLYRNRWSLDVLTKIALGINHQSVNINGTTDITTATSTASYTTGIYAGPDNSGVYQRDVFTMIPELKIELGYQLTQHWRAFVGYDILYWGDVWRSASQIDLKLDPRNFPPSTETGLPFPEFSGKTSTFWAQGINVGAELRF
ncbi:MAG: BBP7 family outer membrane beta-barrel protein [Thermoguttaceae bacterium]